MPVILLSARAGEEATVEGLDAGADDYLVKPFSAAELLARVHAHLELVRLRDALAAGERDRAQEMESIALTLQRSLLPRELPTCAALELACRYLPAERSLRDRRRLLRRDRARRRARGDRDRRRRRARRARRGGDGPDPPGACAPTRSRATRRPR